MPISYQYCKLSIHAGANHPKVGIVLTCVARMYKLKAKAEGSSSIMVQEVSKYLIPVLLALLSISRNYNGLVPLILSFNDETIHVLSRTSLLAVIIITALQTTEYRCCE